MQAVKYRFRHVSADTYKDTVENVKISTTSTESAMARGNAKFFSFAWQVSGGGAVAVLPNNTVGKLPATFPMIKGHSGGIHDFDFSPFNDHVIATASDDCTLKVWSIPEEFNSTSTLFGAKDLVDANINLLGHQKRVSLLAWHPSAEHVLASTSLDKTVKVWDVTKASAPLSFDDNTESFYSLEWNHNGTVLGGTTKDRKMKLIDPRKKAVVAEVNAHEGSKAQKFCFLGNTDYLFTVGYSKQLERQYLVWDNRNLQNGPCGQKIIDTQASVLYPYYDSELGLLYLSGKGDGKIRYYEYISGELHQCLNEYLSPKPGKAYGFYPKRAVNVMKTEIARGIKLGENSVEFIAFIAPRKSEGYHEDLFPDCASEEPALTSDAWLGGETKDPKRRTMNPGTISPTRQQQNLPTIPMERRSEPGQGNHADVANLKQLLENAEKTIAQQKNEIADLQNKLHEANAENARLTSSLEKHKEAPQHADEKSVVPE